MSSSGLFVASWYTSQWSASKPRHCQHYYSHCRRLRRSFRVHIVNLTEVMSGTGIWGASDAGGERKEEGFLHTDVHDPHIDHHFTQWPTTPSLHLHLAINSLAHKGLLTHVRFLAIIPQLECLAMEAAWMFSPPQSFLPFVPSRIYVSDSSPQPSLHTARSRSSDRLTRPTLLRNTCDGPVHNLNRLPVITYLPRNC